MPTTSHQKSAPGSLDWNIGFPHRRQRQANADRRDAGEDSDRAVVGSAPFDRPNTARLIGSVVIPINTATLLRSREQFVHRTEDDTLHWMIGETACNISKAPTLDMLVARR